MRIDRDTVVSAMQERWAEWYGQWTDLRRSGGQMVGLCPLHAEKSPSFYVQPRTGQWHCFGCGGGGDAFTLLDKKDGLMFAAALSQIAAWAGVSDGEEAAGRRKPAPKKPASVKNSASVVARPATPLEPERILNLEPERILNPELADMLHEALLENPKWIKWLRIHRGLTLDTLKAHKIGLKKDGPVWRTTFPVYDAESRLVNQRMHLFAYKEGMDRAQKTLPWNREKGLKAELYPLRQIEESDWALIVEGEADALLAGQMGFPAVTGTLGASNWKPAWTEALAHLPRVVLLFDRDEAGMEGALKIGQELAQRIPDVRIARLPECVEGHGDITDWVIKHGATAEDVQQVLDAAEPVLPLPGQDAPEPSVGGDSFDPEDPGLTKRLADTLTKETHFAQDAAGRLYVYQGGAYGVRGEEHVRRRVKALLCGWKLSEKWSSRRADEVVEFLRVDSPELWERPPLHTLNLNNGLLDVSSRELRPHDPAFLSTVQLPVAYDPAALCPHWDKFGATSLPADSQDFPAELAAWLMLPEMSIEKAVLLQGEGENGKSRFLIGIAAFLGRQNTVSLSLQKLETDKFSVSRLVGKLANICPDLPSAHLTDTGIFKALTGGDIIEAEVKYKMPFDLLPYARLVFSANQPPRSNDPSHAFFRRWLVVPFGTTFETGHFERIPRDVLDARLSDPCEQSGLLNKALAVLDRVRKCGLTETPTMKAAWTEFRAITDPLTVWLENNVVENPDAHVTKVALLKAFNDAARANGGNLMTANSFNRALLRSKTSVQSAQRGEKREWVWLGIGLKSDIMEPNVAQDTKNVQEADFKSQESQLSQVFSNCIHPTDADDAASTNLEVKQLEKSCESCDSYDLKGEEKEESLPERRAVLRRMVLGMGDGDVDTFLRQLTKRFGRNDYAAFELAQLNQAITALESGHWPKLERSNESVPQGDSP